jgi:hypothetical protein
MSEPLTHISRDKVDSEFWVPEDYFSKMSAQIRGYTGIAEFATPSELGKGLQRQWHDEEFRVPEGFFERARNNSLKSLTGSRVLRYLPWTLLSAAAVWLAVMRVSIPEEESPIAYEQMMAQTEIEPEDLLWAGSEDDLYIAFYSLCDTTVLDSAAAVISAEEKLDPRTGLPIAKSSQFKEIGWDDITPTDAMKYLEEHNSDDDYYN